MLNRRYLFMGSVGVLLVTVLVTLLSRDPTPETSSHSSSSLNQDDYVAPPAVTVQYPSEWEVSPQVAAQRAPFEVLFAQSEAASEKNLSVTYLDPEGSVIMQYEIPADDGLPVRQTHLEVFQEPWEFEVEPLSLWQENVELYPGVAEIRDIHGTPVLLVDPHNPYDAEMANAAFARFVLRGIDVQVSGGNDLDRIVTVVEDLVGQQ